MSDSYENNVVDLDTTQNRVCRVAYTLDGMQPVQCTIIDDQPLFYMDFDGDILEEEYAYEGVEDYAFFEHEIETLKHEIAGLEESFAYVESMSAKRYEEFAQNADSLEDMSPVEPKALVAKLKNTLSQSRLGASYLDLAEQYGLRLVISRQVDRAFFDRRSGNILLNPDMEEAELVLILARELRRHWQYRQGVLINPMMFQPEHAILVNRAQEADLTISLIRIAWELQLAGRPDIWERVDDSPMGDLARAFAREAFMDFRTINNGEAAAAVFEAWFLSERCRQQDKKLIQGMLADYKGYVFEHIEASKSVTAELIAGLGSMPYGKNYLAPHAVTIMEDPIFTEVRDRSNANFLWFIKFERTFKETEQELQSESDLSTRDARHGLYNAVSQDPKHGNRKSAEIIQLFASHGENGPPGTRESFSPARSVRERKAHKSLISEAARSANGVCAYAYLDNGFTGLKNDRDSKKTIDLTGGSAQGGTDRRALPGWALPSGWVEEPAGACGLSAQDLLLHGFQNLLKESPAGRLMLKEALDKGWKIALEDLHGGEYCLDVQARLLLLDNKALAPAALDRSRHFRNMMLVSLIKGLRDIWQEKRHGGFDEHYRPEHIMTMERVRAADCDVVSVLVGWELRGAGHGDLWRHLIGAGNGDMAMIYAGHLERDPSSGYNGYALAATFRQWFRDKERVNACDHDTLEYMDDVLGCGVDRNPFGRKKPSRMNIEVLSCLPDKTAYLQGMGGEILSDPLYCGMDDPINQSHLFHILYDLEAIVVRDVPFRDAGLAKKIFPFETEEA